MSRIPEQGGKGCIRARAHTQSGGWQEETGKKRTHTHARARTHTGRRRTSTQTRRSTMTGTTRPPSGIGFHSPAARAPHRPAGQAPPWTPLGGVPQSLRVNRRPKDSCGSTDGLRAQHTHTHIGRHTHTRVGVLLFCASISQQCTWVKCDPPPSGREECMKGLPGCLGAGSEGAPREPPDPPGKHAQVKISHRPRSDAIVPSDQQAAHKVTTTTP